MPVDSVYALGVNNFVEITQSHTDSEIKALKGCRGIVFTHGVRMGERAGGGEKFVRAVSQKP